MQEDQMKESREGRMRTCGGEDFRVPESGLSAVFQRLRNIADRFGGPTGMSRRDFLKTQMGIAAFFLSMNQVFGHFFTVTESEAFEKGAAEERAAVLADQFIFDVQVHYVYENYPSPESLLSLRKAAEGWNHELKGKNPGKEDIQYENFVREVFQQSQTRIALLSNAPADDKKGWFISNEQAIQTRERVNQKLGGRRLLAHAVFTPGQPGWMDELDKAISLRPDAWKGYTLGDPRGTSKYPWRLDDEKLLYPAYEKMERAGIKNICIHKGLLPSGYRRKLSERQIASAGVDDLGKAAKDWPDLNFIIYHSAIEKGIPLQEDAAEFRKTGRIDWVTNLSEIREKYGVENVYAELGAVFATTCVAHPELCAGVLGTLIRGLGQDHVCWGTDSVWFGSPQWQIEAMRRIEIPENMQKQHGFKPLGTADSPIRDLIFGENSARLYDIEPDGV
ncbi:MAG: amidohydrolase [Desulfobacteraceae bacterium]|nr:MAG: amidohydrolase [Desulfobacteraceae bacterium]